MRWSSRVGDLTKPLFGSGPFAPDDPLQRLSEELSGSNPYTTCVDVNLSDTVLRDLHIAIGDLDLLLFQSGDRRI
jgi:hypothetical protein